jgi:hypothetical protein
MSTQALSPPCRRTGSTGTANAGYAPGDMWHPAGRHRPYKTSRSLPVRLRTAWSWVMPGYPNGFSEYGLRHSWNVLTFG